MYEVSVPAKSGVGGGIVAVVPGKFAIGTFAPPLDEAGNSVKGQKAIKAIVEDLGGSVFASSPAGASAP
jgi:glutaminase